jgi:hypothetical protein
MADNETLFLEFSKSEVILEETEHVYVDKNNNFYNSVTGCLSLFTEHFDEDDVAGGVHRQYSNFIRWFSRMPDRDRFDVLEMLNLFVNFKDFAEWQWKVWEGKKYKSLTKKIRDYRSCTEFYSEYSFYEKAYSSNLQRRANIYYLEGNVMSKPAILQMWKDMTKVALYYGNLVHLILERHYLKPYGFLAHKISELDKEILRHYTEINVLVPLFKSKYPHSSHSFDEYEIDCSLFEFSDSLIREYEKVAPNNYRCIVPEKRVKYKNLTGTADVYIDLDASLFDLEDHKTNKVLREKSDYGQKMLPPFDHLDDCEMNKYRLQLSIYSFIIEKKHQKKLNRMGITYYNRKKGVFLLRDIEYMREEAEYLIEFYCDWIEKKKNLYLNSSLGDYIKFKIKPQWMDHFSKYFYHEIKNNRDKDRSFFIKKIDEYHNKFINFDKKLIF